MKPPTSKIDITAVQGFNGDASLLNERIGLGRLIGEELKEGIELGEARLLKRLLTKRFGPGCPIGFVAKLMRRPPISSSCGHEQVLDADTMRRFSFFA